MNFYKTCEYIYDDVMDFCQSFSSIGEKIAYLKWILMQHELGYIEPGEGTFHRHRQMEELDDLVSEYSDYFDYDELFRKKIQIQLESLLIDKQLGENQNDILMKKKEENEIQNFFQLNPDLINSDKIVWLKDGRILCDLFWHLEKEEYIGALSDDDIYNHFVNSNGKDFEEIPLNYDFKKIKWLKGSGEFAYLITSLIEAGFLPKSYKKNYTKIFNNHFETFDGKPFKNLPQNRYCFIKDYIHRKLLIDRIIKDLARK